MLCALDLSDDEEEQTNKDETVRAIATSLPAMRRINKRQAQEEQDEEPQAKRIKYDYQRAYDCIMQDYLGPDPLFGRYFERVFRVTRGITEKLLQVAGHSSGFFIHHVNSVTGDIGIYPESKVLCND